MSDSVGTEIGELAKKMGFKIVELTADRGYATIPVAGNTQPFGSLHGGASAVLAEQLGSMMALIHAGPEKIAVGTELSVSHHRGVTEGLVHAKATAITRGNLLATYNIEIEDDRGLRVATARLTCVIRQNKGTTS